MNNKLGLYLRYYGLLAGILFLSNRLVDIYDVSIAKSYQITGYIEHIRTQTYYRTVKYKGSVKKLRVSINLSNISDTLTFDATSSYSIEFLKLLDRKNKVTLTVAKTSKYFSSFPKYFILAARSQKGNIQIKSKIIQSRLGGIFITTSLIFLLGFQIRSIRRKSKEILHSEPSQKIFN